MSQFEGLEKEEYLIDAVTYMPIKVYNDIII